MKASAVTNGVNDRKTFAASGTRSGRVDLTRDDLLKIYRWMVLSRRLDDKEIQLKNQSRAFFQISGAGHEAIQIAAARELRAGYDWFYPYYRDRALCLVLGVTAEEMLLASVGSKDDPASRGRQMPSHWGSPELHIVSGSSPTGTQLLQAVGCADATVLYERLPNIDNRDELVHPDEVTFTSVGDGSTGEGEFWESINTASGRALPIVFLVEDNGYAISTPAEVHTPGGDISRLVENHPNLKIWRVDGTNVIDSCQVMHEAVAYARARKGPALVHARVTRPYSHSLSDDERLYKTSAERAAEAERDPITVLTQYLKGKRLVEDSELEAIRADIEREVNEAADRALKAPRPDPDTAATWLYSPDVDPTSSAFEGSARCRWEVGHDGRSDQSDTQRRDGAEPPHGHLRSGRDRLQPGGEPRAKSPERAACSRSRTGCSACAAAIESSTRPWRKPTLSAAESAWPPVDSNRWSRFSSSTTSGPR